MALEQAADRAGFSAWALRLGSFLPAICSWTIAPSRLQPPTSNLRDAWLPLLQGPGGSLESATVPVITCSQDMLELGSAHPAFLPSNPSPGLFQCL